MNGQPFDLTRRVRSGARRPRCGADATDVLLPHQRGLPLPRAVAGGAVVRPRAGVGRRLATDRGRGGGVRELAPTVADLGRGGAEPAGHLAGVGRGARRDELLVLPGRRPAATVDGGRDRVPRHRRARGRGRPHAPQPAGAAPRCGRGGRPDRRPHRRAAAGIRVRVRQLPRIHAVRHARASNRQPRCRRRADRHGHPADERDRPTRTVDDHRCARRDPGRYRSGHPRVHPPALAGLGNRGGSVLLGHPVRHRSVGDGPPPPGDLRPDAGHPARGRHRDRLPRPRAGTHAPGPGRDRAGHPRRRAAPRGATGTLRRRRRWCRCPSR
jgi:hypothetical protein